MVADNPNIEIPPPLAKLKKYEIDMAFVRIVRLNVQLVINTKQYGMLQYIEKMLTVFIDEDGAASKTFFVDPKAAAPLTLKEAIKAVNKAYTMSDESINRFSLKSLFRRRK